MEPLCCIERCGRPAELRDRMTGDYFCLNDWRLLVEAGEVDEEDYDVIDEVEMINGCPVGREQVRATANPAEAQRPCDQEARSTEGS